MLYGWCAGGLWRLWDWLTLVGAAVIVAWLAAMPLAPLARSGRLPYMSWMAFEPSGDAETGGAVRIVGGVLARHSTQSTVQQAL